MGGLCALFFDGAICQFNELPKPDNKEEINRVYTYLNSIRTKTNISMMSYGKNKSKSKFNIKQWLKF